jgi:thiol-disulfide isomerase/thioredoxin
VALFAVPVHAADGLVLRGTTLDGRAFDIASLRGKVVLVFFWSTDCAVCLSKLPELRLNADGWRNRPFEMVLVNVDRQRSDVTGYESARAAVSPRGTRPHPALWRGEAGYADSLPGAPGRLPLSLLIDPQGAVAERFEGRIPADAWDRIAELLP